MPCGSEGKRSSLGHVCLSRRKVKSFLSSSLAQSTSVVYTGLFSSPWASVEGMGEEREGKRKRERERAREQSKRPQPLSETRVSSKEAKKFPQGVGELKVFRHKLQALMLT
jgi:hypothetical protein